MSNTQIKSDFLEKTYKNYELQQNYRNKNAHNAIVAIPTNAFVQSKQVNKARIPLTADELSKAPVSQFTPVTQGKPILRTVKPAEVKRVIENHPSRPVVKKIEQKIKSVKQN